MNTILKTFDMRILMCHASSCSTIKKDWFTHVVDTSTINIDKRQKFINIYHEHAYRYSRSFRYILEHIFISSTRKTCLIMEADALLQNDTFILPTNLQSFEVIRLGYDLFGDADHNLWSANGKCHSKCICRPVSQNTCLVNSRCDIRGTVATAYNRKAAAKFLKHMDYVDSIMLKKRRYSGIDMWWPKITDTMLLVTPTVFVQNQTMFPHIYTQKKWKKVLHTPQISSQNSVLYAKTCLFSREEPNRGGLKNQIS